MPPPVLSHRLPVAGNLPRRLVDILNSCVFIIVELYRRSSPTLSRRSCSRLSRTRITWSWNLYEGQIRVELILLLVFLLVFFESL